MKMRIRFRIVTKKYLRQILLWITSISLTVCVAFGFVFIVLQVVDWYYISRHPIALVEKDLGYGLVLIFWLIPALIAAIPIAGISLRKFKRLISKRLSQTATTADTGRTWQIYFERQWPGAADLHVSLEDWREVK